MNLHDNNLERNIEIAKRFYEKQEKRARVLDHALWGSLGFATALVIVAVSGRVLGGW